MVSSVLVADAKPRASRTAQAQLMLAGNANESTSKRIRFNNGATIVGFVVTISPNGVPAVGRRTPTLSDLLVRLDSPELPLTKGDDDEGFSKYVSAKSIDLSSRFFLLELKGNADITVQARWVNNDNSTPIFEDSIVTVAALYDPEG